MNSSLGASNKSVKQGLVVILVLIAKKKNIRLSHRFGGEKNNIYNDHRTNRSKRTNNL